MFVGVRVFEFLVSLLICLHVGFFVCSACFVCCVFLFGVPLRCLVCLRLFGWLFVCLILLLLGFVVMILG